MSKIFTFLAVFLLFAYSGFAQEENAADQPAKKSYTGIKGGVNFSRFSGENLSGQSMQVGANGGIYFLYMESKHFGIQPEIQYSLQGTGMGNGHLLMHYAVVPVMFKFFPDPAVAIQAGPYAGVLLSSEVESDSYQAQYAGKGQDFGLAYGLSVGNESTVTVSIRHHVGLSNLSTESGKVKNQTIQLSLGVCISQK